MQILVDDNLKKTVGSMFEVTVIYGGTASSSFTNKTLKFYLKFSRENKCFKN